MLMRSFQFAAVFAALACASALRADDAKSSEPSPQAIKQLITLLGDNTFDQRELATRRLIALGKPVIPFLASAAEKNDPETSWRAVHALLEIALSQDAEAVDPAEEVLTSLVRSKNDVAACRAEVAIIALAPMRQARAVAALKHMGANVTFEDSSVLLDNNWTGGDAGLKHLSRLSDLRQINIEPTAKISDIAVERLRNELPDVRIIKFGEGFLGVGTAPIDDGPGLTVLTIVPGGAAEKAGLGEQDVIHQIDGKPVDLFDDLVKAIAGKRAGDEIEIDFTSRTTGQRKRVKAKLGFRPGVKE